MYRYNKYGNVKTTVGNLKFDSKKEAKRFEELKFLLKAKEIYRLRLQQSFTLCDSYTLPDGNKEKGMKYIADFTYYTKEGEFIVEDVKGRKTDVYKIKKKLMQEIFGIEIKEV